MKKVLSLSMAILLVFSLGLPIFSVSADAVSYLEEIDPHPCAAVLEALDGKIVMPDEEDYLSDYHKSYVKAPKGESVNCYYGPKAESVRFSILDGSRVKVLAEHGAFSCVVDIDQSKAGWVRTANLDDNYYGQQNPVCDDLRKELESWDNIEELVIAYGTIIGIKKDYSIVCAKTSEAGIDLSNWGKLKKLCVVEFDYGDACYYGISPDGKARFFHSGEFVDWGLRKVEEEDTTYGGTVRDIRYIENVMDIDGEDGYHFLCLADGRLRLGQRYGWHVWDYNERLDVDFLIYDSGKQRWCFYCKDSNDSTIRYWQQSDGSFDWEAGEKLSGDHAYLFSKLVTNIKQVTREWDGRIYALRENGSLIICSGVLSYWLQNLEKTEQGYAVLDNFLNIDHIDGDVFVKKDGTRINMDGEIVTEEMEQEFIPRNLPGWETVKSVVHYGSNCTLGVTEEGKIVIAGVLPGEKA